MPPFRYASAPVKTTGLPPGIPFIVGNEFAERFSFYGMRAVLVTFMTQHLLNASGQLDLMSPEQAKGYFHLFVWAVYFFPLLGAILSDALWGKYKTIILLSVVYCLGNFVLALDSTRWGLAVGLVLISIGSGGIKPCVSANVGDQFGPSNQHLLPKVFGWFYFSINCGSSISMLLTPVLMDRYGPRWAFGVPGIFMLLATVIFWLGRRKFVHIPPAGRDFVRETFSLEGLRIMGRLASLYLFVTVFWSLYDQSSSAWVLQAAHMNLNWLWLTWKPEQLQALNPLLVLAFIPLFSYAIYPAMNRLFSLTPLRKISIGLFLALGSFLVSAWIENQIGAGLKPSVGWQFVAYVFMTAAEIMVSITFLEFSYTQAPAKMKSLVMSFYLLAMAFGNLLTSAVNFVIQNPDGTSKLAGPSYYYFFSALMLAASIAFLFVARGYREKTHIQAEVESPAG